MPYYTDANPPETVARNFDMACLASFERRVGANGAETAPQLPRVFSIGGRDPAAQGALTAIGLLEISGVPFCAALLRNDRTVVTAQHCYAYASRDIEKGRVAVRPIVGNRGPWKISANQVLKPASDSMAVKDDWAVLTIATTDAIGAADTVLSKMAKPESVTLVAHYAHYGSVEYANPAAPDWRKGLRFPKPNLCVTVEVRNGCLQLVCQTVRGFSGAPIFRSGSSAGSPIEVVGFVSQPTQETAQCPTSLLTSTLAVSADVVGQISLASRGN